MKTKPLFIRKETHANEYRTPLVPKDVLTLIRSGFPVYIERSPERIYKDDEYKNVGAVITTDEWYTANKALILGIKELDSLEKLNGHTHAYFSHSLKGQAGAGEILQAFAKSQSKLYDFEFFTSEENKRLISFGWYAGVVGAVLGLQRSITKVTPWSSLEEMLASVSLPEKNPRIAVIGWQGRCGTGVCDILNRFRLEYTRIGRNDEIENLYSYDIVYNCITLDASYTKVWFLSTNPPPDHPVTVIDISCDSSKSNNPIAVYNEPTTWESPFIEPQPNLRVLAIENLPSLVPKESSDHFSSILTRLLLEDKAEKIWEHAVCRFHEAIAL